MLVLSRSVPELQPIPLDAVREDSSAKYASKVAARPGGDRRLVPGTPLQAGVELQQGMLIEQPALAPGEREISVLINADTGVAGKLRPGDNVDVLATFQSDDNTVARQRAHDHPPRPGHHRRDPARGREPGSTGRRRAGPGAQQVLVPVTFALRPTLALRLTYAETFASEIRLALIRRGDESARCQRQARVHAAADDRPQALPQGN